MRKIIFFISGVIVFLLLGYASFRGYAVWKQSHGLAMARNYYAQADVRNAVLALQQVLKANPRNLDACRMMAAMAEAARSSDGLLWRQRVVDINPKSLPDRLALAQAAMTSQDYLLASNTLAGVAESDQATADYQNVAGAVSCFGGKLDQAEAHFSEAIRLDPSNLYSQVYLADVRLSQTNALDMAEARIALQRVIMNSTNAALCGMARRVLIKDALRFNDFNTALTLSQALAQQTNSGFTDKLLRLNVLLKVNSAEFKPTLALYQRIAATNPAELFDLANWQVNQQSPADALGWLQSLPIQTRTNQMAALLIAKCQLQLGDWRGLQAGLQSQNWSEFEYIRHALQARSLREQNLIEASVAEWGVSVKYASEPGQKARLNALFSLIASWKWNSEMEQILWAVVKNYPEEKWAPAALNRFLVDARRTRSLMELSKIIHERDPADIAAENNLALIALLLGAQELNPYQLSQEVYSKAPKYPPFASTYAFALYLQKKNSEALKVIQQLAATDLANPSIAGYYGLILKANGNPAEARNYLNLAARGSLLPEEQALFNQAQAGL